MSDPAKADDEEPKDIGKFYQPMHTSIFDLAM